MGFVGFCNLKKDLFNDISAIKNMNLKLKKTIPDEEEYFFNKNINLANRIVTDSENSKKLMSIKYNEITYTIVYNGNVYNKDEVKKELQELGYKFERKFRHRDFIESFYTIWNKYISKIKWSF